MNLIILAFCGDDSTRLLTKEVVMADQIITQSDLANLGSKMDEMESVLNGKERTILLAVFKLAAQAISSRLQSQQAGQTESGSMGGRMTTAGGAGIRAGALAQGFKGAFSAIGSKDFTLQ